MKDMVSFVTETVNDTDGNDFAYEERIDIKNEQRKEIRHNFV